LFQLTGTGPFDVVYTDGSEWYTLTGIFNGHTVKVLADSDRVFTLVVVSETGGAGCASSVNASVSIDVLEEYTVMRTFSLCDGDSVLLSGEWVYSSGSFTEQLQAANGCDSVVINEVTLHPVYASTVTESSCDSAFIGVFETAFLSVSGCDSTITRIVEYAPADTTRLDAFSCDPDAVGENITYHIAMDGCDSVVIQTIQLLPASSDTVFLTTCIPAEAGVFGETLINQYGCDSLLTTIVSLAPTDTTRISMTTCDSLLAGESVELMSNQYGCDSLVVTTATFIPAKETVLTGYTCNVQEAGVFVFTHIAASGCDSIVRETVTWFPSDTQYIFDLTCNVSDTGLVISVLQNQNGCDSTILNHTHLAPEDSCASHQLSKKIFVPDVFSPNGDNVNDVLSLYGDPLEIAAVTYLRVFDRWGELMDNEINLIPNDPSRGWDGTFRGKRAMPGVYVWVAEVEFQDASVRVFHGSVTLVR
jgi:gliding motility-associated-like protein